MYDPKYYSRSLACVGYPNYTITCDGRIYSVLSDIWLKPSIDSGMRYNQIELSSNGISKRFQLHRLVAIAFIDNPENKPEINHKDGNKQNNHVDNLEWCTDRENKIHAVETGLVEETLISDNIVHNICRLLCSGKTCVEIEGIVNVPSEYIHNIKSGKKRKNISQCYDFSNTIIYKKRIDADGKDNVSKLIKIGYTNMEISNITGFGVRTVERVKWVESKRPYVKRNRNIVK